MLSKRFLPDKNQTEHFDERNWSSFLNLHLLLSGTQNRSDIMSKFGYGATFSNHLLFSETQPTSYSKSKIKYSVLARPTSFYRIFVTSVLRKSGCIRDAERTIHCKSCAFSPKRRLKCFFTFQSKLSNG